MSIFKKSGEGFLAKLFKHKQVEELAQELAHTYADEIQEELQSEGDEPTTAEDTAAEPVSNSPNIAEMVLISIKTLLL